MIGWLIGIVYVIGLVITPIVIGFIQPPICMQCDANDGLDNFSVCLATIFWPAVVAFITVVATADFSLSQMTTIGERLRKWYDGIS